MEVDVSNLHLISKIFTVKDEMTKETNTFVSEPNEEEYVLQAFVHVALCDFNALKTLRVRAYSRFNPSNKKLADMAKDENLAKVVATLQIIENLSTVI